MQYITRLLEQPIRKAARNFAALLLTGPRRSGKTTLLRKSFPNAAYYLLEDPDVIARVRTDPRSFVDGIKPPAILDEIQNTPELFNYLRTRIDLYPHQKGRWLLTGSQDAPLMHKVSESMAGRIAIFELLPFSLQEEPRKVSMIRGGFPEILAKPSSADIWFRSYLQTYLERDIRMLSSIRDLPTFRRFIALTASRSGQLLNKTDIAAPLGMSVPTVTEWLHLLEITGQILLIPPFYENFGKRLIKSPKIYWIDSGLACYLLGIQTEAALRKSPFFGSLFEGFVASEIVKHQLNHGKRKELYYFRDEQGLEVDFILPCGAGKISLLEVKAGQTVFPSATASVNRLEKAIKRYRIRKWVIHMPASKERIKTKALSPRTHAVSLHEFIHAL